MADKQTSYFQEEKKSKESYAQNPFQGHHHCNVVHLCLKWTNVHNFDQIIQNTQHKQNHLFYQGFD